MRVPEQSPLLYVTSLPIGFRVRAVERITGQFLNALPYWPDAQIQHLTGQKSAYETASPSSFVNGFKNYAMVLFPDQYGDTSHTMNVDTTLGYG